MTIRHSFQIFFEEADYEEGNHPLYVLVFGDDEEISTFRTLPTSAPLPPLNWTQWATLHLERGDESLIANFGIDIRILGFINWESDDDKKKMEDLWFELKDDTMQYLRTWYDGEWWSNYVDAIIGITAQATPETPVTDGVAPRPDMLDKGWNFNLIKWVVYWSGDNVVQHEVSHLFYADDHLEPQPPAPCCAMAKHTHFVAYIYEDGFFWWLFHHVRCLYITNLWCDECHQVILQNCTRYPVQLLNISASGGTTNPALGPHAYSRGSSVNVTAIPDSGHHFSHWTLDGVKHYQNPITVTMDSDHNLTAYFTRAAMKTLTNGWFYIPNIQTNRLRIELLFSNADLEGDQTGGSSPYSNLNYWPNGIVNILDIYFMMGLFLVEEGQANWQYMADCVPDRIINTLDIYRAIAHYMREGDYSTDLSLVSVEFNTGQVWGPDLDGFVLIPQGATSFTVKWYGQPIAATITFH